MSKKIAKKRGFDNIANDAVNRSGSGDTDFRDSMANAEKAGNTDADRHESEKLDKTNDSEGDK